LTGQQTGIINWIAVSNPEPVSLHFSVFTLLHSSADFLKKADHWKSAVRKPAAARPVSPHAAGIKKAMISFFVLTASLTAILHSSVVLPHQSFRHLLAQV
jgi:hypothetical protein